MLNEIKTILAKNKQITNKEIYQILAKNKPNYTKNDVATIMMAVVNLGLKFWYDIDTDTAIFY